MVNKILIRSSLNFYTVFVSIKLSFNNKKTIYILAFKVDYFAISQYNDLQFKGINIPGSPKVATTIQTP